MIIRQIAKPVIVGISGTKLTDAERKLFQDHHPLGVILFSRNIKKNANEEQDKEELIKLIADIKEVLGKNVIICIDQEGGRVKRLRLPTFYDAPAAKIFGDLAAKEGIERAKEQCKQNYSNIAKELKSLGINLDFAPVADLIHLGGHKIIGDRSFSSKPEIVLHLCLAALEGLQQEGVTGCIKHIPGHGRAKVDSHEELPRVDVSIEILEETDFRVFKELAVFSKVKLAMTAHIVYEALDPNNPATLSREVISYIRNEIGFEGLIISDAIDMNALNGKMKDITKGVLNAGVDIVLECTGKLDNMFEVLSNVHEVSIDKFSSLFIV